LNTNVAQTTERVLLEINQPFDKSQRRTTFVWTRRDICTSVWEMAAPRGIHRTMRRIWTRCWEDVTDRCGWSSAVRDSSDESFCEPWRGRRGLGIRASQSMAFLVRSGLRGDSLPPTSARTPEKKWTLSIGQGTMAGDAMRRAFVTTRLQAAKLRLQNFRLSFPICRVRPD
jgi:hypothetical protein